MLNFRVKKKTSVITKNTSKNGFVPKHNSLNMKTPQTNINP